MLPTSDASAKSCFTPPITRAGAGAGLSSDFQPRNGCRTVYVQSPVRTIVIVAWMCRKHSPDSQQYSSCYIARKSGNAAQIPQQKSSGLRPGVILHCEQAPSWHVAQLGPTGWLETAVITCPNTKQAVLKCSSTRC
eukprot:COSAG04_NODE_794_length_10264_cov_35.102804_11_plen_136_part_00